MKHFAIIQNKQIGLYKKVYSHLEIILFIKNNPKVDDFIIEYY